MAAVCLHCRARWHDATFPRTRFEESSPSRPSLSRPGTQVKWNVKCLTTSPISHEQSVPPERTGVQQNKCKSQGLTLARSIMGKSAVLRPRNPRKKPTCQRLPKSSVIIFVCQEAQRRMLHNCRQGSERPRSSVTSPVCPPR